MTEKLITSFLLILSTIYLSFAKQLTFGTLQDPRSGFLPVLAGAVAVTTALLLLYQQFRGKNAPSPNTMSWTKFIFILIGFLFYITMFNLIGYFAATFIFLFYLFKIADTAGWCSPFIIAAVSSAGFHFLFKHFLAVTLP